MLASTQISDKQAIRLFIYFAIAHVVVWTILPWLVSPNIPLDVAEGYGWGQQFLLGTYKHPPMPSWWLGLTATITGHAGYGHFLDSQIAIVIALWAVWDLARKITNPLTALAAVLLLETIPYYNYLSTEFNHNVLLVCFWALMIRSFYFAVTTNQLRHWLLFGLWTACGMYSKYFTALIIIVLFLFTLVHPLLRQRFKSSGPYIAIAVCFVLFLPHLLWLVHYHFLPIVYTEGRLDETTRSEFFLKPVFKFTLTQLCLLLPMLAIGWLLKDKQVKQPVLQITDRFNRQFLAVVTLGPFLFTCLISVLMKASLKDMWAMPIWNFVSLWFIVACCGVLQKMRKSFVVAWSAWIIAIVIIYIMTTVGQPYFKNKVKRIMFPGTQMAQTMTQQWEDKYHTPLAYAIGETWVIGNLAFYSPTHPTVFTENNPLISQWIHVDDVKKKGGIYLNWHCEYGCTEAQSQQQSVDFAEQVKRAYPNAQIQPELVLKPQTSSNKLKPVIIDWAMIPPEN